MNQAIGVSKQFHSVKAAAQIIKNGDKDLLVEHALPFAPPIEETMHEHWKKTANFAPVMRRDRSKM